jgi:AAA15 family ATPase/GTPase
MRIETVELKNGYKRFHHLTIRLGNKPARIVALVGPNGCGKSSVLDGLLFQQNAYEQIGSTGGRDAQYHSLHGQSIYSPDSILIQFDRGAYPQVRQDKTKKGNQNTIFSFRSCYRYNSSVKIIQTRAVDPIGYNRYGASTASDIDEKMEENYRRLRAKYNKYMEETNSTPSGTKEKIIGDLNSSLRKCLDLQIVSIGNVEANEGTIYFKKPDHPNSFEFNVLSAGEKEVVDILLDLYLRQDDYDDTVFLIDEPELHINTAIQRKLLVEINRLIGPNCQLWVATHSAGFLRAIQEDLRDQCQVIHFKAGLPYASQPISLEPVTPSLHVWREIFETALDDLAGLVSPKRLIYCEGRAEPGHGGRERGLDAKVLNAIFSAHYTDTLFISSGGNTELDQRSAIALAILSKVFPAIEIWILKDRDMASGKPTSEHDRQMYLQNNEVSHRVLRRWEIENYLYDEEVLAAYCTANGLAFDRVKYQSLVHNIVDDDVKKLTVGIKTACGLVGSISPDTFKLNLANVITTEMAVFRELEACIFERK